MAILNNKLKDGFQIQDFSRNEDPNQTMLNSATVPIANNKTAILNSKVKGQNLPQNQAQNQTMMNSSMNPSNNINPEKIEIDDNDTVQGRIQGIIDNSPLMQRAQARSSSESNRRGVYNSTMGVQAGEAALYDTALPIAAKDSDTSFAAKRANQDAQNSFNLQERRGQIDLQLQSADAVTREKLLKEQGEIDKQLQQSRFEGEGSLIEKRGEIEKQLQTADAATREKLLNQQADIDSRLTTQRHIQEIEMQGIRGGQAKELAELENQYAMLRQTSQSSAGLFSIAMSEISQILSNKDIPLAQKTTMLNNQIAFLRSALSVIGSIGNVDIAKLFTP